MLSEFVIDGRGKAYLLTGYSYKGVLIFRGVTILSGYAGVIVNNLQGLNDFEQYTGDIVDSAVFVGPLNQNLVCLFEVVSV